MKGIFITGTDTNVGKTWVGSQLIKQLCSNNIDVIPRKPVESGWLDSDITKTDTWILANATGKQLDLQEVCPNRFKDPISPERAAKNESIILTLKTIKENCLSKTKEDSFLFVEGAGGFYSPLCSDALNADLMVALGLPVILIAEDKLGCINQVLLNVDAMERKGISLLAIVLNNTSDNKKALINNQKDLETRVSYPIISMQDNSRTALEKLTNLILE